MYILGETYMQRKHTLLIILFVLVLIFTLSLVACSKKSSNNTEDTPSPAPGPTPSTQSYVLEFSSSSNEMGTVSARTSTGTIQSGSSIQEGTAITISATANAGYSLDGWYVSNQKVGAASEYTLNMPSANVNVQARFTANQYALNYSSEDTNKGTVASSTASGSNVAYKTSITITATANTGYSFDGWYKGTEKVSTSLEYTFTMPAEATTVVAKFVANTYALIYSSEDNAKGSVTSSIVSGSSVAFGTSVVISATANSGYTFEGWYKGTEKINSSAQYAFNMPAEATALVAKFTTNSYALIYSSEDTNKGIVEGTITSGTNVAFGSSVTIRAIANTGYSFDGWYEGTQKINAPAEYTFTMPASAKTYIAKFVINKYTLVYASEDTSKGTVQCSITSGSEVDFNTSVIVTSVDNTGYDFEGWYKGTSKVSPDSTYVFNMPAEAVVLQAKFVAEKRNVYFYDGTSLVETIEVDYNTKVTPPSVSKLNYNFIGWYEDRTFNTIFDNRDITTNLNLYARWEQAVIYYDVRFLDWDDAQIGATQSVEQGKSAIIPASPTRIGYDFTGWTSTSSYAAVTEDVTVHATYTKKQFTITFLMEENGSTYTTQQVRYLEQVVLPMTPTQADYIFTAWFYNGYAYDFSLAVDDNLTLYATWTEKPPVTYTVTFYDGTGLDKQVVDTQTVVSGGAATAPASPQKVGYVFKEWDKAFDNITADLDVYATYDEATQEVTFVYYLGDELKEVPQVVSYGAAAVAPVSYQRTGYTFVEWDKAFDNVTEDLVVTAVYEIKMFTAIYYNGAEELLRNQAEYGGIFPVPATPSVAGYSFIGWYKDGGFLEVFDFTEAVTDNANVYGKFEEIVLESYTVTFIDYDGTPVSEQTVVRGNAAIDPGRLTRTGYTFTGWNKEFDNITSNLEVIAQYSINQYTVTYLAEDRSTEIGQEVVDYNSDASELVTPPSINGKTFVRWSSDITRVTKTITVYAIYDTHVLNVYFVEQDNTPITSQLVSYGNTASVPDTPVKTGYIFLGWYANDSLTVAYDFNTVITDEDGTYIYAAWEEASGLYSVYFKDYDGNSYGNVQRIVAGYYALEPNAPDKLGVEFDGWYIEGTNTKFDFDTMPITRTITLIARAK